jgi:chaperonin cofactor prefoldin
MNKTEIAAALRKEAGHLELEIKKLQARCEKLKTFVLDLEAEIAGPDTQRTAPESQFRKVIDSVFGEKPKRPRR